ncbi:MAG TPA: DMT family transporter [Candidatus Baltobacteraceae bacterium]|jgi:transporter family-2 protein|nr:DMT family transporter [Candidatus Baltobacteraceae bacterium]
MKTLSSLGVAFLALLAGAGLPFQAGMNAQLRLTLGSPMRASLVHFVIAVAGFLLFALLIERAPLPTAEALVHGPAWMWFGGFMGAFYVLSTIIVVPRLGAGIAFALVVAGQMLVALLIDRFGLMNLPQVPVTLSRVVGAALLVVSVLLIRR